MADELRAGPGPKTNYLDDLSGMFRNKLAGPSYFDGAAELVNRLLAKPSASQNLAAWEYNKTPPMPNEGQTNMLGKLLGMVPENAMFAANFLGPGVKPTMPAPKPQGIRAYHGSPHDFDQFSLAHKGKGEGAAAFGEGLYFAEKESVAKNYRDNLAGNSGTPGKLYEVNINADPEHFLDWDKLLSQQNEKVRQAFPAELHNMRGSDAHDALAEMKAGPIAPGADSGWESFVNTINDKVQRRDLAAQSLRDAGVPGIKYLDKLSRGAGEGSRNYVVFDDKLIEILRKYGLMPPAVAAGAAALGQGDQQ